MNENSAELQETGASRKSVMVVCEDGHFNNKLTGINIADCVIPTRVRPGETTHRSLMSNNDLDVSVEYMTDGGTNSKVAYTINPQVVEPLDRVSYHGSVANRVMVHHCLRAVSITPEVDVDLVVGLPLSLYYSDASKQIPNADLILKKKLSLQKPVYQCIKDENGNLVVVEDSALKIKSVSVFPQGIAAYYSLLINDSSDDKTKAVGDYSIDDVLATTLVGILDLGGGTLDLAIINEGAISSDIPNSILSRDIGMHTVMAAYVSEMSKANIPVAGLTDSRIRKSYDEGKLRVGGKEHDTVVYKQNAINIVVAEIVRIVDGVFQPYKLSLEALYCIGGGSLELKDELYKVLSDEDHGYNNVIIPDESLMLNANGMKKMKLYTE